MVKVFLYSYLSLLSDSPLTKEHGHKPLKLFSRFIAKFETDGLKSTILRLADLSHEWVSHLTNTGVGSTTGDFLDQFKDTPIFMEYLEWYKTADPKLMKYIYTFLNFGKKLWYVDEELNAIAFRDWQRIEAKLSDLSLPVDVLPWLRKAISSLIDPVEDSSLLYPKFGPGSVFELGLRGAIAKSNNLRYDARLDRAFFRSYFVNFGLNADSGYSAENFFLGMQPKSKENHDVSAARLRFVPKTVKTARSICMETNTRMCFQQAYLRVLLSQMDNDICKRFIRFDDQGRNRALSGYGSSTNDIDTIDLSAASDSVSLELVRSVFPKRELYFLLATRSSEVDVSAVQEPSLSKSEAPMASVDPRRRVSPNRENSLAQRGTSLTRHQDTDVVAGGSSSRRGRSNSDPLLVQVNKFAPMGSALCFPTQSLIFTGVIITAAILSVFDGHFPDEKVFESEYPNMRVFIEKHFYEDAGFIHPSLEHKFQPASVYGDDICVDSRLTQNVTSLLSSLGFSVNNGKSFTASQSFRESCGAYWWSGYDITPLYFRIPYHRERNAEVFMSALSLANEAGDRGYRNLRRYLIHYLLDEYRSVRFSSKREDTGAIYSTSVRNSHLRSRYNVDYQRDEVLGVAVVPKKYRRPSRREKNAYESYLYLRWQASRISGIVLDDFSSTPRYDSSGARLAGAWTPS